jgi:hypothetical protein
MALVQLEEIQLLQEQEEQYWLKVVPEVQLLMARQQLEVLAQLLLVIQVLVQAQLLAQMAVAVILHLVVLVVPVLMVVVLVAQREQQKMMEQTVWLLEEEVVAHLYQMDPIIQAETEPEEKYKLHTHQLLHVNLL